MITHGWSYRKLVATQSNLTDYIRQYKNLDQLAYEMEAITQPLRYSGAVEDSGGPQLAQDFEPDISTMIQLSPWLDEQDISTIMVLAPMSRELDILDMMWLSPDPEEQDISAMMRLSPMPGEKDISTMIQPFWGVTMHGCGQHTTQPEMMMQVLSNESLMYGKRFHFQPSIVTIINCFPTHVPIDVDIANKHKSITSPAKDDRS